MIAFLALEWSDTISIGTVILGVFVALATLLGTIYGVKYKVNAEVQAKNVEIQEKARDAAMDLYHMKDDESKALYDSLMECKDMVGKQAETIARLEQLPNLERIIQLMGEQSVRQDAAAEKRLEYAMVALREALSESNMEHEVRVLARHAEMLAEVRQNRIAIEQLISEVTQERGEK